MSAPYSPNISRHRNARGERNSPKSSPRKMHSRPLIKQQNGRKGSSPTKKVTLTDFQIVQKVGKGGYGEVYLAVHKKTQKRLALKQMQKELISKEDKIEHIKNERNILIKSKSPFLIRLHYSFQDADSLYLAMEYCPGGDLRALLMALGSLEEEDAQIYFAEMIEGVHAIHKMDYIHRDIKPANFLISETGHLKLADFGLSKGKNSKVKKFKARKKQRGHRDSPQINRKSLMPGKQIDPIVINKENFDAKFRRTRAPTIRKSTSARPMNLRPQRLDRRSSRQICTNNQRFRTYSVVGSPDYMSPEVIGEGGYGEEVDWWSLGCCFFEMIMGIPPFTGDTPDEVFDNIRDWKTVIPALLNQYRCYMTPECFSLISGLLSEPHKRLGFVDSLRKHPFFKNFDWNKVSEMEPPFVPKLSNPNDTSAFTSRMEGLEREGDLMNPTQSNTTNSPDAQQQQEQQSQTQPGDSPSSSGIIEEADKIINEIRNNEYKFKR